MPESDNITVTYVEPVAPTAEDLHCLGMQPVRWLTRDDFAEKYGFPDPVSKQADAFARMLRFYAELGRSKAEEENARKLPQGQSLGSAIDRHAALAVSAAYRSADRR